MARARRKLLDAAVSVIRTKGFEATTVDELCATAGVAKGSFFHHFKSKEALGIAAVDYWAKLSDALFAAAPYRQLEDPLDRLFGYFDFRKALLIGRGVPKFTCLLGTMVQEIYVTYPEIRAVCEDSFDAHAAMLESDIAAAIERHGILPGINARSLALYILVVLQGSYVLAKAKGSGEIAAESIDHLRRYVEILFEA